MKLSKFLALVLVFAGSFFLINVLESETVSAACFAPVKYSGSIYRFGITEDGSQEPGTLTPVQNCVFSPGDLGLAANERIAEVRIGSYVNNGECLSGGWEPTRAPYDYADWLGECANPSNNNPVRGSNYNNRKLIGYVDDGVIINFPDGSQLCSSFPADGCTTPDYNADLSTFTPRSAGFLKDRFKAVGSSIGAPKNSDGYITSPFTIGFRAKQQYLPGFMVWLALDVKIVTIDEPEISEWNCENFPSFGRYQTLDTSPAPPDGPYSTSGAAGPGNNGTFNEQTAQQVTAVYEQHGKTIDWAPKGRTTSAIKADYLPMLEYPYDTHTLTHDVIIYWRVVTYTSKYSPEVADNPDTEDVDEYQAGYWYFDYSYGPEQSSADGGRSSPEMPECFYRGFDILPTFNNIQWDNVEEVTQLILGSQVYTEYVEDSDAPSSKLHKPNQIKSVPVSVEVTLYHSDGRGPESYPMPLDPSCPNDFGDGSYVPPSSTSFNTVTNNSLDCYQAKIPPLTAGDYACVKISFPFTKGTVDSDGEVKTSNTSLSIPSPEGTTANALGCTTWLVNRPYFTVYGGDVSAGSPFVDLSGACPVNTADITGWNRSDKFASPVYPNSMYGGAGTNMAAYASGVIEVVSTATLRSAPGPLGGLAFANETTPPGKWSGNNFSCLPNYMAEATGDKPPSSNISGLDGSYVETGSFTINDSTVGNGQRIAIFAETIIINGNISISKTGYNSIDEIPSVRLIARNIFISPNVTEIDATLIAQVDESGAGGELYTCSNGGTGNPTDFSISHGACSANPLLVRGSLIASTVHLTRGAGSLRNSNLGNDYSFTSATPNVAEHVIYSPSVWLTRFRTLSQDEAPYDAFTTMPPIL